MEKLYKLKNTDSGIKTNYDEKINNFDDMELSEELLRGIYAYGFVSPSIVQQKAIFPIKKAHDVIIQSQSGTGKTGTFAIGLLSRIDTSNDKVQSIVLAPTRDLAIQTGLCIEQIGKYMNIKTHTLIGGRSVRKDINILQNSNIHVISGTPGRVLHMLSQNYLNASNVLTFILDEADIMLDRGFVEQIYNVFKYLKSSVQVCLFSATMPEQCLKITTEFMKSPKIVLLKSDELTLRGISQYYVDVEKTEYKLDVLCDIYDTFIVSQAIIFCNKLKTVLWLEEQMKRRDFTIGTIHSELEQKERDYIMGEFRDGRTRVLIATDLVARGIDVHGVSLVINYDIPINKENYIHRIGRSGRFGRKGISINFVTQDTMRFQREIEQFYETEIKPLPKEIGKDISSVSTDIS